MTSVATDRSNQAIILGCSHAHGDEIWLGEEDSGAIGNEEDFGLRHSFASQIAQGLGLQICNHAMGGGSNDAIFRIWMELHETLRPDDVVIACWTGRHRTELWHATEQMWLPISPGARQHRKRQQDALHRQGRMTNQLVRSNDDYARFTDQWHVFANDTVSATNNKIKNIVALNSVAAEHGVRVINIHAFDPVECAIMSRYEWPVDQDFCGFCEQNNYKRTRMYHYFRDAHTAFAQLVLSRLHG